MSQAQQPTQYQIQKIEIEGRDIKGLLVELDYFESIYIPATGGSLTIMDSSHAGFIEENNIEFVEEFKFSVTNAEGESLDFQGKLNGLRNEQMKQQLKIYTIDYTSEPVRENEQARVVGMIKNQPPQQIVKDMIKEIGGKTDKIQGNGEPMNFTGNFRRPTDIIRHVCTHGVDKGQVEDPSPSSSKPQEKKIKGTTGYLCWETADGYRFNTVKTIMEGGAGGQTKEYEYKMQNVGENLSESMTGIIDVQFDQIGDYQSHQRGGAFINYLISYDMDKGIYAEFEQKDQTEASGKMKQETKKPTRYFYRNYIPENFQNGCEKAQDNKWDQSRKFLSQNAVSQNTAPDTIGNFVIPPSLKIRAGDTFKCKISKVTSGQGGGYDRKHSGKYVVKQVGHHFGGDGRGYTKLNTMRSTKQQNDASS